MATYRPRLVKQGDGTRCQWQNCVAASTAMALDRHTRGNKTITPKRIRDYYGQYCPGIPYSIAAAAVRSVKGETLSQRYGITKEQFKDLVRSGRGCILHIRYSKVMGTPYQATGSFYGLHAVYVNKHRKNPKTGRSEYLVYDPLADGRHPWIPKGPQWWPATLVYNAAESTGGYHTVFTRDTE